MEVARRANRDKRFRPLDRARQLTGPVIARLDNPIVEENPDIHFSLKSIRRYDFFRRNMMGLVELQQFLFKPTFEMR